MRGSVMRARAPPVDAAEAAAPLAAENAEAAAADTEEDAESEDDAEAAEDAAEDAAAVDAAVCGVALLLSLTTETCVALTGCAPAVAPSDFLGELPLPAGALAEIFPLGSMLDRCGGSAGDNKGAGVE